MVLRPVYLLLFSLTLLALISGSSAVMALAGKGRDVLVFSMGVGLGTVASLSAEPRAVAFVQGAPATDAVRDYQRGGRCSARRN